MTGVGSQVLEVAFGLLFIYLLFSLVCSALHELASTVLGWRAEHLERGLRQILQGEMRSGAPVIEELLAHPRIQELTTSSKARKTRPLPSYISARGRRDPGRARRCPAARSCLAMSARTCAR